jgi:molecular chaperone DnaK
VQSAIARVKEVMSRDDVQAIRRAVEELQAASQAMAQHLQGRQAQAAAGPSPSGDGRGGQGKEDVIDAEFEVKK